MLRISDAHIKRNRVEAGKCRRINQLKKIGSVEINWKIVLTLLGAAAIVASAPAAVALPKSDTS